MKLYTSFTSKKKSIAASMTVLVTVVVISLFFVVTTYQTVTVGAKSKQQGLSTTKLGDFAQAGILYYNPGECISGKKGSGAACGSTAEEIYWSTISKYNNDPIKVAGIIGNLVSEGGMNPVAWEGYPSYGNGGVNSSGELVGGWDAYYNGSITSTGVGAFAITSGLDSYLQYVNDSRPDLVDYFKDTKEYSYNWLYHPEDCSTNAEHPVYGDCLLDKIGASEFGNLVEFEVEYALGEKFEPGTTQEYWDTDFSTPSDAAYWWMDRWERPGVRNPEDRERYAEDAYDMYKDFTCSSGSSKTTSSSGDSSASSTTSPVSSSSSVSGSDIIWIGDSDSALAHDDEDRLIERTFPGLDYGPSFNTDGSYIQSGKFIDYDDGGNLSGLRILKDIIDQNKLRPYLVFALGGNGGWDKASMDEFLELIDGKDVKVIITTTKYRNIDYAEGNELARKTAKEYPNIYLADVAANYKDEYIDDTDIEFTAEGSQMFVQTIKDALDKASGKSCISFEGDYPEYRQYADPWGGLPYGPNNGDNGRWNYGNSGCGATSMAVIATMTSGQDVFPTDITDTLTKKESQITEGSKWYDSGYMRILDPLVCEEYGCEVKEISTSADEVRQYLKDGWFIHTSGGSANATSTCGGGHSSTCPYSAEGHYIALLDIDNNDNVTIEDPGWGDTAIQTYKLSDIINNMGAAVAIRGNGVGVKCDDDTNTCGNNNKTTGTSGFSSTSDAQFIIDEYLAADMSGYSLVDPGTRNGVKDNCVAFSCWFITNYTEISYPGGLTGDGNQFVDIFYDAKKSDYPDLEISNEPSVYSVASWGIPTLGTPSGNHTGIVIGIDKENDKIIIAEAGYAAPDFMGIHEYPYHEAVGDPSYKYVNLNKYLKSSTGLK